MWTELVARETRDCITKHQTHGIITLLIHCTFVAFCRHSSIARASKIAHNNFGANMLNFDTSAQPKPRYNCTRSVTLLA